MQVASLQPPAAAHGDRRPGVLTLSCCGASGQKVDLSWKCSRHASPDGAGLAEARWEFRRVLSSLGGQLEPHIIIKDQKFILPQVFKSLGLDFAQHVLPSRHALAQKAGRNKVQSAGASEQEWVITTAGIVVLLHHWGLTRKRVSDRGTAQLVCQAFFEGCIDPGVAKSFALALGAHHLQLCGAGAKDGACWHATGFASKVAAATGSPQHLANQALQLASTQSATCPALAAHAKSLLQAVVHHIHVHLDQVLKEDILKHATDLELFAKSGKRRRIDEDLRQALVTEAHRKGLGWSSGTIAKCKGICARATATRMDTELLRQYKASGHLLMASGLRSLTISLDCSRLGNPADDVLLCAWWEAQHNIGGWLAPQVSRS